MNYVISLTNYIVSENKKINEKHPNLIKYDKNKTVFENLLELENLYIEDNEKYLIISESSKEIPELIEAKKLETDREKALMDYALSVMDFENQKNDIQDKLFSEEYLNKMYEYADKGVFIFFIDTPALPILDNDVTEKDFLD